MAVRRMVWGEPDPNLVLAAEVGDVGSMKALGRHFYDVGGRGEPAERWLLAAAEVGDGEAMYCLSRVYWDRAVNRYPEGDAEASLSTQWCRRAAETGWPQAVRAMAWKSGIGAEEREPWLRRAAEAGDQHAMTSLARLAEERERPDDAERWYRTAVDHGVTHARTDLSRLLMRQGRLREAEQWVRPEAEAGEVSGIGLLADVLHELGRTDEAATWREKYELLEDQGLDTQSTKSAGTLPQLATVAVTALVTTAVVPFIQALVSKAADDAYGQARNLVRRLMRQDAQRPADAASVESVDESAGATTGEEPPGDEQPGLLIADDTRTGITLFVWSNASDESLRALSSLDMDELSLRRPDQGRVRLVWHPTTGRWHIRGE
ncbi:hypothetical protein ACIPSE_11965 [Streptomyces sp. NPDC090106]|uniref:hypothetical protein n=1 Tax=Streptomyces sp. NPDC090106 TaxID=3365946 RepID=UPI003821CE68